MSESIPKISVLMCVYNTEKYLDESIQSVLAQTFDNFEFLIINDASTDSSEKIIAKYLDDKRIVYIKNEKNLGIGKSHNVGIELARGEIIANMDSDDVCLPTRLEKQYKLLSEQPEIAIVGTFVEVIDEQGKTLDWISKPVSPEEIRKKCFFYGPFTHPTIMFRSAAVKAVGMYRGKYDMCEDIDLYLRLIYSGYSGSNVPEYLLKWRLHPKSTNRRYKEKAFISFRLKEEFLRTFKPKLGIVVRLSMYVHFILDMILTFNQKRAVEAWVKKIINIYDKLVLKIWKK